MTTFAAEYDATEDRIDTYYSYDPDTGEVYGYMHGWSDSFYEYERNTQTGYSRSYSYTPIDHPGTANNDYPRITERITYPDGTSYVRTVSHEDLQTEETTSGDWTYRVYTDGGDDYDWQSKEYLFTVDDDIYDYHYIGFTYDNGDVYTETVLDDGGKEIYVFDGGDSTGLIEATYLFDADGVVVSTLETTDEGVAREKTHHDDGTTAQIMNDDAMDVFDWDTQTISFDETGRLAALYIKTDDGVSLSETWSASGDDLVGQAQLLDLADAFEWQSSTIKTGTDGAIDTAWTLFDDGTTTHLTFADSGAAYAKINDASDLTDWSQLTFYSSADGTHTSARVLWDDGQSEVMDIADLADGMTDYDPFATATDYAEMHADVLYTVV